MTTECFYCFAETSTIEAHPMSNKCEEQIQKIVDILERFEDESREKQVEKRRRNNGILQPSFLIAFSLSCLESPF